MAKNKIERIDQEIAKTRESFCLHCLIYKVHELSFWASFTVPFPERLINIPPPARLVNNFFHKFRGFFPYTK